MTGGRIVLRALYTQNRLLCNASKGDSLTRPPFRGPPDFQNASVHNFLPKRPEWKGTAKPKPLLIGPGPCALVQPGYATWWAGVGGGVDRRQQMR